MNPYTAVPQQLKDLPNWVCWKLESRNDEITKIPYDPKTGRNAKADDPSTWATFEQAVEVSDILNDGDYSGIGFEWLGTPFVGIDFDGAVHDGVVDPFVTAVLKQFGNPYCELSPSGEGLHAFVECAALPKGKRKLSKDHTGIEIYSGAEKGRYFTVTGTQQSGSGIPKIDDISLPYLLITQNRDAKFKSLWLGDTSAQDGDDSSADFALMCRLAVLTQNDPVKMEKYFGASTLGQRDKWKNREAYRQSTVAAAIETNHVKGRNQHVGLEFHSTARPDPDGEYVIGPVDGQDEGWFPLGDISLIGGASGVGKTTWIFEMLHKQKQGWPVLEHRTYKYSFQVLAYDRGRNAFTRTMRRLRLLPTDIPTTALELAFGTAAVQGIINEIEKMSPTPSIIFIEGLDMLIDDANKKSTVSPFMRQLQKVAAHFHIALICSVGAPKSKRGEEYAAKRDKISGSEAWGRNCETVIVIEFSAEDDGTAPQREMTVLPRNAAAEKFTFQFEGGRLVRIQPTVPEEMTPVIGRPNQALQTAIQFIEQQLQGGPRDSKELAQHAFDEENITRATFFRAAKALKITKTDKGRVWELSPMHSEIGYMPDMGDMESATL